MTDDLHATATTLTAHGIRVLPVRADGTKAPALRAWQDHPTTQDDVDTWFGGPTPRHTALGVATGPASGNLEMVEIEGGYTAQAATVGEALTAANRAELWARLNTGWVETSPSGGLHWFYRVDGIDVPGNTKLAAEDVQVDGHRERHTIAETRGRGGQTVVAPTGGHAHPSGKPWVLAIGGPATIPTLTAEEREDLHAAFRTLDRVRARQPDPTPVAAYTTAPRNPEDGTPPGVDFETVTWPEILEPAGWTIHHVSGRTTYWTRPGKDPRFGFSATTGHAEDRDRLFVFTTATEFDPETPYTKFGAYATLHYGGDYSKAASGLRAGRHTPDGRRFGTEPHRTVASVDELRAYTVHAPTSTSTGTDGPDPEPTLATVTALPGAAERLTTLDMSDDGNAQALVDRYGDQLRYCPDRARWLYWNGQYWEWQPASGGFARELAKQIGRAMPERPDWATHKRRSLSARGIADMLSLAATDPRIAVDFDALDAHPWELNTPAGILDLTTGTLRPADPAQLHTRMTRHAPDPEADATRWETFLADTFGDPHLVDYMQRLVGYSAVGLVREHVLPFCYGEGGNGKGTFLESITNVLGGYATSSPNGFLMANSFAQHSTEIARLSGARMVICSEVNRDDRFDEAKTKSLTGGDRLVARFMRQDDFDFRPTHTLWLFGNDKPDVTAGGNSFWRRLRLVPFTRTFDGPDAAPEDRARRVEGLQDILADDINGPALMHWIAQGAAAYYQRGLTAPPEVEAATRAYASEVDTIGRFLEERCLTGDAYAAQVERVTDVRAAYEQWCHESGEKPVTGRAFATGLARHGIETGRGVPKGTNGARMVRGLMLARPEGGDGPGSGWAWALAGGDQ